MCGPKGILLLVCERAVKGRIRAAAAGAPLAGLPALRAPAPNPAWDSPGARLGPGGCLEPLGRFPGQIFFGQISWQYRRGPWQEQCGPGRQRAPGAALGAGERDVQFCEETLKRRRLFV